MNRIPIDAEIKNIDSTPEEVNSAFDFINRFVNINLTLLKETFNKA